MDSKLGLNFASSNMKYTNQSLMFIPNKFLSTKPKWQSPPQAPVFYSQGDL